MKLKVLLLALILVSCSHAYEKKWVRNTNFNNPDNWEVGRKPCSADTIYMPEDTTVFLQTNNSIKQMILPNNGFLVLSESIALSFSDTSNEEGCEGEEVYFSDSDGRDWFDPDYWKSESSIPLETEAVPCYWDHVIFPQDNSFKVQLEEDVTIQSLTFDGKDYSTEEFAEFMGTEFGQTQFVGNSNMSEPAQVLITNQPCTEEAGCVCGNDITFRDRICSLTDCGTVSCSNALTPNGSCCQLCGATVIMDYMHGEFILTDFEQAVNELLQPSTNRTKRSSVDASSEDEVVVSIFVSRTSSDKIQMVVTDNATGYQSGNTAGDRAQFIAQDIQNNMEKYGVTNVKVERSSKGTPTSGGNKSLSGGGIAGIIIGILCACVLLAFIIVLFVKRSPGQSWTLPSLPSMPTMPWNQSRWQEENMVTFNQSNGRRSGSAEAGVVGLGFDNPIYDSERSSREGNGNGRLSTYQAAAQFMQMEESSFSNPVYNGEVNESDDPFTAFDTVNIETEGDDTITGFSNPATVEVSLEGDNEVDIVED